jgi:hypothetical protein
MALKDTSEAAVRTAVFLPKSHAIRKFPVLTFDQRTIYEDMPAALAKFVI